MRNEGIVMIDILHQEGKEEKISLMYQHLVTVGYVYNILKLY